MPGPTPEFAIRPAVAADLGTLLALSQESFGQASWTRAMFADLLAVANRDGLSSRVLCLLADSAPGVAAGYAVAQVAAEQAEILSFAVRPEARRQGCGSRLLVELLEAAAGYGATEAFLEVRIGNGGARAFYQRHGFIETGRRSGYYADTGEAALVLKRSLR